MSYDSDSSSGDEDFSETNVLLGYATKEPTGDNRNQLGGRPSWLTSESTPSGSLAKCRICQTYMTLLLQLNGDLPERFPGHERRLYIFSCKRKACRRKDGSVRAIRGVSIATRRAKETVKRENRTPSSIAKEPATSKPQQDLGGMLFGGRDSSVSRPSNPFASPGASSNANPFSSTSTSQPQESVASSAPDITLEKNLSETFASQLQLSQEDKSQHEGLPPHEPWPSESDLPSAYPSYFLDADYEALGLLAENQPEPKDLNAYDLDDQTESFKTKANTMADAFESQLDKSFLRFADRLAHNPEQVLRYEYGGAPLLYSHSDPVGTRLVPSDSNGGLPSCPNCTAPRVFELQLTPHAITELEAEEQGLDGMDWGTIILGVCSADCAPRHEKSREKQEGYVEEWVGVQWEELGGKQPR